MKTHLMFSKTFVCGVLVLFMGASISSSAFMISESYEPVDDDVSAVTFNFDGNTLYVGGSGDGNYSSIQAAINDASDGDTVFVYNDSSPYYENIVICKTIDLIGEDKDTTVIDGGGSGHVVGIGGDGSEVNLSGFTIQNSGDHWDDFGIGDSGIMIFDVFFNTRMICGNNIVNNNCGISLYCSDNNIISENIISGNEIGIYLPGGLGFCSNNTISNNIIINNGYGIFFDSPGNNYIFHNDFVNNNIQHACDGWSNIWDDGYPSGGNYWDDYSGEDNYHGPSQNISGSDGIGDTPYNISGGSNQDRYPFIEPYVIQSDLECEGGFAWVDIAPGATVTGTFTVKNIGDPDSKLDWEIESYPDWGTWTFTPESGIDLTPEDGPITVEVEVIAPFEELTDFSGCVRVVNQENSSDFDEIPIMLPTGSYSKITKPDKAIYINDKKIIPFFAPVIIGDITIDATACSLIDEVEFYVDGELRYTDTSFPFSWIWDEPAFFKHTIETIAINNSEDIHSHKEITVWKLF